MNEKLIYDLPTRVFHWLFALLFITAFTIGSSVDDDSYVFSFHMLAGMVLCSLAILRILWGFIGTEYAAFRSFPLHPRELVNYLSGIVRGSDRKWIGHNPASSWAAVAMIALALGLGISGYLMSSGQGGEDLAEIHEILANGFLIVALLHVAGTTLHSLRHKDFLWKSMINGRKLHIPDNTSQVYTHSSLGVLLLAATIGLAALLVQNFDSKSRNLTLFGSQLHLGEAEESDHEYGGKKSRHEPQRKRRDRDNEED